MQESLASVMTSFSMSRSPVRHEKILAAIPMMTLWVRRTSSLRIYRTYGGLKPLMHSKCSRCPCKLDAARAMLTTEIYVVALWISQTFSLSIKLSTKTKRTKTSDILASCLSRRAQVVDFDQHAIRLCEPACISIVFSVHRTRSLPQNVLLRHNGRLLSRNRKDTSEGALQINFSHLPTWRCVNPKKFSTELKLSTRTKNVVFDDSE